MKKIKLRKKRNISKTNPQIEGATAMPIEKKQDLQEMETDKEREKNDIDLAKKIFHALKNEVEKKHLVFESDDVDDEDEENTYFRMYTMRQLFELLTNKPTKNNSQWISLIISQTQKMINLGFSDKKVQTRIKLIPTQMTKKDELNFRLH